MSMDAATKNLDALAGWQQRLEAHLEKADAKGVKDAAALGEVLADLDAIDAPVLLKQRTLGAALLRFPNAIDMIAKLRSRDSGRPLDGTTLLRHVETGLVAGIETILTRDSKATTTNGTQAEPAEGIRDSVDAARTKIVEEHTLRELGRRLDETSMETLQSRKTEVQGLNDGPLGVTIKAYLALHTNKASWLGNASWLGMSEIGALPLGDTGLFFGRDGIVAGGVKESYGDGEFDRAKHYDAIFVRLRPHHLGGVPTAEVERAMETLIQNIASRDVPPLDTRSFFFLRHGNTNEGQLQQLQGGNVAVAPSTAKTRKSWEEVVAVRLASLTQVEPAFVAVHLDKIRAGNLDVLDALSDRLRKIPGPTLDWVTASIEQYDELNPRIPYKPLAQQDNNGWTIHNTVRPILSAIKESQSEPAPAASISAKLKSYTEVAAARRAEWSDTVTELQAGIASLKPREIGSFIGLKVSAQHNLYVTDKGLCTSEINAHGWRRSFHPADDRLIASIDPIDFAIMTGLSRRDFLANGQFGYRQTSEHPFVPSHVES